MIEREIAYHLAPALAGIKPANIVSLCKKKFSAIHREIKDLNEQLNCRGIYFEILCECEKRVLVMGYRKNVLWGYLCTEEIRRLLSSFGYCVEKGAEECIDCLKKRMALKDFPHEIGAFLGYPVHDIYGFIEHRGEGCLLTGEWKVYENAEEAERLFKRYNTCRCALAARIEQGKRLFEIFSAAA